MKRVFAFLSVFAIALLMFGMGSKTVLAEAQPAEGKFFENPYLIKDENGEVIEIPMYIMDSIYTTFPAYFDYEGAKGTEYEDKLWGGSVRMYPWSGVKVVVTQFADGAATGKVYGEYIQGGNKADEVGIGKGIFTTSGTWNNGTFLEGGNYIRGNAPDPSLSFFCINDKDTDVVMDYMASTDKGANNRQAYVIFDGEGKAVSGLTVQELFDNGLVDFDYYWDANGVGTDDASKARNKMVDGEEDDLNSPILDDEGNPTGEYNKVKVDSGEKDRIEGYRLVWRYMESAPTNLNSSFLGAGWKSDNWDFYNAETKLAVCFVPEYVGTYGTVDAAMLAVDTTVAAGHVRAPYNDVVVPAGGFVDQIGYLNRSTAAFYGGKWLDMAAQAFLYGRDAAYKAELQCSNYASGDLAFAENVQNGKGYALLEGTNIVEIVAGEKVNFSQMINLSGIAYAFADLSDPASFKSSIMTAEAKAAVKADFVKDAIAQLKTEEAWGVLTTWMVEEEAKKTTPSAAIATAEIELAKQNAILANLEATAKAEAATAADYIAAQTAIATAKSTLANEKVSLAALEATLSNKEAELKAKTAAIETTQQFIAYKQAVVESQAQVDKYKATKASYESIGMDKLFADKYAAVLNELAAKEGDLTNATTTLETYKTNEDTKLATLKAEVATAKVNVDSQKTKIGTARVFNDNGSLKTEATGLELAVITAENAAQAIIDGKVAAAAGGAAAKAAAAAQQTIINEKKAEIETIRLAIKEKKLTAEYGDYVLEEGNKVAADKNYDGSDLVDGKDADGDVVYKRAGGIAAKAAEMAEEMYAKWLVTEYRDEISNEYTVVVNGVTAVYKYPYATWEDMIKDFEKDLNAWYTVYNGSAAKPELTVADIYPIGGKSLNWEMISTSANSDLFWGSADMRTKWGWMISYVCNVRAANGLSTSYWEGVAETGITASPGTFNSEISNFLNRKHRTAWPASSDYSDPESENCNGYLPDDFTEYELSTAGYVAGDHISVNTTVYNPITKLTYNMPLEFVVVANTASYTPVLTVDGKALVVSDVANFELESIAKAYNRAYNELNKSVAGQEISHKIVFDAPEFEADKANGQLAGSYQVKMTVENGGNTVTKFATVKVADTIAPVVRVRDVTVAFGSDFHFLDGVIGAWDNVEGNLLNATYVWYSLDSQEVNTWVPGDYDVKVTAMDKAGNMTTATYTCTVNEIEADGEEVADALAELEDNLTELINSSTTSLKDLVTDAKESIEASINGVEGKLDTANATVDSIKGTTETIKTTTDNTEDVAKATQVAAEDNGLVVVATVLAGIAALAGIGAVALSLLKRK